jgi:hypothetical protein
MASFYTHMCEVCLVNEAAKFTNFCGQECANLNFEAQLKVEEAFKKDRAFCYVCGTCKNIGCDHFPKV